MKGESEPLSTENEAKIDNILRTDRITWVELDFSLAVDARKIAGSWPETC